MSAAFSRQMARFDALKPRERLLIAVCALVSILFLGYSFVIDPAMKQAARAEKANSEDRVRLSGVQAQMAALQSPAADPDVAARAELDGLKNQLAELAARLQAKERSLVPPQEIPSLLEEMIGAKTGLRLLSLKTLPAAPLLERPAGSGDKTKTLEKTPTKAEAPTVGLFKHGVEIRLEGSYQDLTAYLQRLEQTQLKLLWSGVALSADAHPKLVLTLTVYTLSLDRAWLIV